MSFEDRIATRSAAVYADFLLPHLHDEPRLLDCGTGDGTIALGLATAAQGGRVVALDRDSSAPREALAYARRVAVAQPVFVTGDVRRLPFADESFDVVFSHSMLETQSEPLLALAEMGRVLRRGGLVALACVEYSGVVCGGPHGDLLRRFYAAKERIWQLEKLADPRMGQRLRGLLHQAGFEGVEASARYISHGTTKDVRAFGRGRAADCRAAWFAPPAVRHGLLTAPQLDAIHDAWLDWSESAEAFAAFSWCRAIGRKSDRADP